MTCCFLCFLFFLVLVFAQEAPQSHDILVFMTGQEEIEALARTCRDIAKHLPDSCGPMVVIPLYASLPPTQQLRVFQPAPKVKLAAPRHAGRRCGVYICELLLSAGTQAPTPLLNAV